MHLKWLLLYLPSIVLLIIALCCNPMVPSIHNKQNAHELFLAGAFFWMLLASAIRVLTWSIRADSKSSREPRVFEVVAPAKDRDESGR